MGSSLLLGIEALTVDRVLIDDEGRRVVHCSTDPELAGWCPACRQQSSSPKDRVTTRPRDVRIGPDRPILLWHKRKWHCRVSECDRKVFTEELPEDIPARARITTRARRAAGVPIGDHLRPVLGVADEFGMDWKIAHEAFVAYADEVLPDAPPPVTVLGLDETRRGKGRYEVVTSAAVIRVAGTAGPGVAGRDHPRVDGHVPRRTPALLASRCPTRSSWSTRYT